MRLPVLLLALVLSATSAHGAGLPGGASALNETHGDWTVHCEAQNEVVACGLQQRQIDKASGQQILGVDINPNANGLDGVLVLPFGLALERGVSLAIDDAQPVQQLGFRTCLPAGCLVNLALSPEIANALRVGTVLHVGVMADGGGEAPLNVSLKGFAGALDRTLQLLAGS